jgi:AMIN domain-containing protein
MTKFLSAALGVALLISASYAAAKVSTIHKVSVLSGAEGTELEILTDDLITPNVQVVTGPDRLVIDFPNATPAATLRNVTIAHGEVTGIRVGLFSSAPPVTRVVVDLRMPQTYQVFPSHKSVIVKLGPPQTEFEVVDAPPPPVPQGPKVRVSYRGDKLTVWAEKATLAEVLNEIHKQTGADIAIPSGAEQEQVIANYGPGPAEQVIGALLNGSRFNFVTVGDPSNPNRLSSVILMPRTGGVTPNNAPTPYGQQQQAQQRPTTIPPPPPQPVEADTEQPQ